jgi:ABC-type multidrug transport system fused ATPase/permease subunit
VVIPNNLRGLLGTVLSVFGTITVIVYSMPIFLVVVIPIGIAYYFLQKFYVATARQVKRMESISRSPIYTHFGETISGGATIRAYSRAGAFIKENETRIDRNQMCYYPTICANRWLSIRLECIGNLIIMFASLMAVLSRGTIDPGIVGLSLSYALNVTGALNQLVRMTTDVETNMVSVERIREYQEVAQEAPFDVPENDPSASWPEHGMIDFENYETRFRPGLDLVLKGISCRILSGEKIGIVGRTGAGKSTMTLALFRLYLLDVSS